MIDQVFLLAALAFLGTGGLVFVFVSLVTRGEPAEERLRDLSRPTDRRPAPTGLGKFALAALPKAAAPLLPTAEAEQTRLQARLIQAGFYGRGTLAVFLGAKFVLLVTLPLLVLVVAGLLLRLEPRMVVILAASAGGAALLLPNFWLDSRKASRQNQLRRALPDALDVIVICLEGGLSLTEGIRRVSGELRTAHPPLAAEMTIIQREILLGLSPGESLRRFADRADLEEVRSLAAVLLQSERFGSSLVKGLRTHAEVLRRRRQQRVEEQAQQAAVKILFPTLLCIFPAVFIVFMGPAVIKIWGMFAATGPR